MHRSLRYVFGLALLTALCGGLGAALGAQPDATPESPPTKLSLLELPVPESVFTKTDRRWFGVYAYGHKAGWAVQSLGPATVEGRPCISVSFEMSTEFKAFSRIIRRFTSTRRCYWKDPPYRAFLIEQTDKLGDQIRHVTMRSDAGSEYAVEVTEGGKTKSGNYLRVDARLCQETSPAVWAADPGRRPGDAATFFAFVPGASLRCGEQTFSIRREGHRQGAAGRIPVWVVDAFDHATESRYSTGMARRDGQAVILRLDGDMELRNESEQAAKHLPEIAPDVYVLKSIRCSRRLGNPAALTELVLELTAPEGKRVPDLPDTANQTVERKPDGRVIVKISRNGGKPQPASEQDRVKALEASGRYPLADETVRELAAKAVGGAKDDRAKVERLLQFTRSHVRYALNGKALSVMDVIQSGQGDCTAHSLLFTTLARASGLPAREAGGWFYAGDRNMAFGGHAWCEVILDGHWVPVDSVPGEMQLSPGHIQEYSAGSGPPAPRELVTGLEARVLSFRTAK